MIFSWHILLLSLLFMNTPDPKPKTAYRIFDQQGHEQDYGQMLQTLTSADVILFGELHDNPICHWLQRELAQDLLTEKKTDLILGAEMFEADDQIIIREIPQGPDH